MMDHGIHGIHGRGRGSGAYVGREEHGFTLTEMLVVLLIIGGLSAIAFPIVSSGIRASHRAGCLSNLRQIGVGLEAYLQDHNDRMPELEAGRKSRDENLPVLETVLTPYLGETEVFHCPADKELYAASGSSYLWNTTQNGRHRTQLAFFGVERNDSRIPLVIDKEAWHVGGDSGSNFLYADFSASNRLQFSVSP